MNFAGDKLVNFFLHNPMGEEIGEGTLGGLLAGGAIYVSGGDDRPCFPNLCVSNLIVDGCEFEGNILKSHEPE